MPEQYACVKADHKLGFMWLAASEIEDLRLCLISLKGRATEKNGDMEKRGSLFTGSLPK